MAAPIVSTALRPISGFYGLDEKSSLWSLTKVVTKQALITLLALGCFFNVPYLFFPSFVFGIAIQEQLVRPFDRIHRIYNITVQVATLPLPIFKVIFAIGALVAFPHTWSLGAISMGLWSGKRLVDLSNYYYNIS